ncbi:MAG: hypothetical protein EBZ48_16100, partial [Proteobacteria bacterium]|nr:hypothetical protein [Pseudomonadota bacterium]
FFFVKFNNLMYRMELNSYFVVHLWSMVYFFEKNNFFKNVQQSLSIPIRQQPLLSSCLVNASRILLVIFT